MGVSGRCWESRKASRSSKGEKLSLPICLPFRVEEVSMKWMDRPSVTEMERGGVYEMEIEISSIHFCDTWSGYPFHIDRNSLKKNLE